MIVEKTCLRNGIRVISDKQDHTNAVSLGVWVNSGSSDEASSIAGMSHLIEHMVFRGTRNKTALQIVRSLEAVGSEVNAFTSREHTCFYSTLLGENLDLGFEVLSDLVMNATFPKVEFEKEKQVISEEIGVFFDSPEEYVFDAYFENGYKGNSNGQPILGTKASLGSISRKMLIDFYKSRYVGSNIVICASGKIEHLKLVELSKKYLGRLKKGTPLKKNRLVKTKKFTSIIERPLEQIHILLGFPAPTYRSKNLPEELILSSYLGGGMSSILYRKVREQRALAYSIYSYQHIQRDTGVEFIYSGTGKENVQKLLRIVLGEITRLKDTGISERELKMCKSQLRGQFLLISEDLEYRMNTLATDELILGKLRSFEASVEEIMAITTKAIRKYLSKNWDLNRMGLVLLGAVDEGSRESIENTIKKYVG